MAPGENAKTSKSQNVKTHDGAESPSLGCRRCGTLETRRQKKSKLNVLELSEISSFPRGRGISVEPRSHLATKPRRVKATPFPTEGGRYVRRALAVTARADEPPVAPCVGRPRSLSPLSRVNFHTCSMCALARGGNAIRR